MAIFMAAGADNTDMRRERMFAAAKAGEHYLRLDPRIGASGSPEPDNAPAKNILALQAAGRALVAKERTTPEHFIAALRAGAS